MKKILIATMTLIFLASCSQSKKELFAKTDRFVGSLQTYRSYGIRGIENKIYTSDFKYQITPIGRLINVKIMSEVDNETYESLKEDLAQHYKKDSRVNDVYICNAGTIIIDCRN